MQNQFAWYIVESPVCHIPDSFDLQLGDLLELSGEVTYYGEWAPNITFTNDMGEFIQTEDFGSNETHLRKGISKVAEETDLTVTCSISFLSPPPEDLGSYEFQPTVDFEKRFVHMFNLTTGKNCKNSVASILYSTI